VFVDGERRFAEVPKRSDARPIRSRFYARFDGSYVRPGRCSAGMISFIKRFTAFRQFSSSGSGVNGAKSTRVFYYESAS
jgi:hypothetical protein